MTKLDCLFISGVLTVPKMERAVKQGLMNLVSINFFYPKLWINIRWHIDKPGIHSFYKDFYSTQKR